MPAVLHMLVLVLAVVVVGLWFTGQLGLAVGWIAIAVAVLLALVVVVLYARRMERGITPALDLRRVRAGVAQRSGRLGDAAAGYASARDAPGIRRVAFDAAHDAAAADALSGAALAYFSLTATITTARRHAVVPSSLLERASESADAAAAQLWRSCDRLAVVGSGQSARIDLVLRSYERAVGSVRAEFESARDGIVQVAVGRLLEAQLADVTARLARLDNASRSIDEAMAEALS